MSLMQWWLGSLLWEHTQEVGILNCCQLTFSKKIDISRWLFYYVCITKLCWRRTKGKVLWEHHWQQCVKIITNNFVCPTDKEPRNVCFYECIVFALYKKDSVLLFMHKKSELWCGCLEVHSLWDYSTSDLIFLVMACIHVNKGNFISSCVIVEYACCYHCIIYISTNPYNDLVFLFAPDVYI